MKLQERLPLRNTSSCQISPSYFCFVFFFPPLPLQKCFLWEALTAAFHSCQTSAPRASPAQAQCTLCSHFGLELGVRFIPWIPPELGRLAATKTFLWGMKTISQPAQHTGGPQPPRPKARKMGASLLYWLLPLGSWSHLGLRAKAYSSSTSRPQIMASGKSHCDLDLPLRSLQASLEPPDPKTTQCP